MKKTICITAAVLLAGGVTFAGPYPINLVNDIYDSTPDSTPTPLNTGIDLYTAANALLGTSYTLNEQLDPRFVASHALWTLPSGSGAVALIGLSAGFNNTVGFYSDAGVGAVKTDLLGPDTGSGIKPTPYAGAQFSASGAFGFYINANQQTYYYSEPSLHSDGLDHMVAYSLSELVGQTISVDFGSGAVSYKLNNPYLIGWEDLPLSGSALGDEDYNDMMYLFDAAPVSTPDSGSLLLIFAGVAGGMILGRRLLAA